MNSTINISLPRTMLADVKKTIGKRGFTSISEFFRDAARHYLYPHITENGFTPEFEEKVLGFAKESLSQSKAWKNTKDIDRYFKKLSRKIRENGKNKADT